MLIFDLKVTGKLKIKFGPQVNATVFYQVEVWKVDNYPAMNIVEIVCFIIW